jgi:hypothetical protein
MKQLVDAVLAKGKIPMIPLIGYTNEPNHNANIPAYNAKIEQLYSEYPQIVHGPDFWTFFTARPELVGAGDVHPTGQGDAAMRQLWAETLLSGVYAGPPGQADPTGLHASGNRIVNGAGQPVQLIGVNHSGTEYACVGGGTHGGTGYGIFEPAESSPLPTPSGSSPPPPAGELTIWPADTVPAVPSAQDAAPVELGMRFRSDVGGLALGVRFYKGEQNTGRHTGSLWDTCGHPLATATFTDESPSGWQEVRFDHPVGISRDRVYVASYHTDSGHYAASRYYFQGRSVDNGALHAPVGGNGVFKYGDGGFPSQSWKATNYYVDVVLRLTVGEWPLSHVAGDQAGRQSRPALNPDPSND